MVESIVQMEEEEDRIVREVDVYLSSPSASEYHLLQYPGHFLQNPLPPQAVRIKPRHHLLEAEHTMNTAAHHSASTRVYQSQTIPIPTHLCLGRVVMDEAATKASLHLIPISQISQMRPTFHHLMTNDDDDAEDHEALDEADPRVLDARTRHESIADDVLPLVPSSSIAFHRKESDRAVAARKSSYAHQQASQESEAWMPLRVVVADRTADPTLGTTLPLSASFRSRSNYMKSLNYITLKTTKDASISLPDAHHGMVPTLWHVLQSTGGPVPLSILRMAAALDSPSAITEASSLFWETLNVLAVVVRGNWYLHSQYLRRPVAMQRLRTLALLLLQDFGRIDRPALQIVVDATMSEERMVLRVLRPLAQPSSSRHTWVPKLADDPSISQKYPAVAKLHEAYWQKQRVRLAKEWQLYSERLRK